MIKARDKTGLRRKGRMRCPGSELHNIGGGMGGGGGFELNYRENLKDLVRVMVYKRRIGMI